ncbi:MAG: hypothetical protein KBT13_08725 [Bacteroidales bacterium]|nr:hypothetical protein [Candidatus Sodaliphilus limicaballi]
MNKRTIPATITPTLAIGSTGAAPYYDVNITQQLCSPACVDETPVFAPQFTLKGVSQVGTNQYIAVIHVEGVINYIPCGYGSCCTRSQVVSQDFTIPVYKATAPVVTLTAGQAQNGIARVSCCDCSKTFVSDVPLTLTIA